MTNFIEINSLIVNKSDYRDYVIQSRLTKSGFISNKTYINIDKIINYTYPSGQLYYYKDYNTHDDTVKEQHVNLHVFEVKMDNGDIYIIEKEYFNKFILDIEQINKERYIKNINITYPEISKSKKKKKYS